MIGLAVRALLKAEGGGSMVPEKFPEANKNLLKPSSMTDAECASLWVFNDESQCISRWKLTWRERLKALIYGRIWLSVHSGVTQPPVWLSADKTVFQPANPYDQLRKEAEKFA